MIAGDAEGAATELTAHLHLSLDLIRALDDLEPSHPEPREETA